MFRWNSACFHPHHQLLRATCAIQLAPTNILVLLACTRIFVIPTWGSRLCLLINWVVRWVSYSVTSIYMYMYIKCEQVSSQKITSRPVPQSACSKWCSQTAYKTVLLCHTNSSSLSTLFCRTNFLRIDSNRPNAVTELSYLGWVPKSHKISPDAGLQYGWAKSGKGRRGGGRFVSLAVSQLFLKRRHLSRRIGHEQPSLTHPFITVILKNIGDIGA